MVAAHHAKASGSLFTDVDLEKSCPSARMNVLGPQISERFGVQLRPWQAHAIDSLLSGNDVVITAGTGSEKSLVFQSLALGRPDAVVLIVAPLNGIMDNQVSSELEVADRSDMCRW